jgi:hypothetical protein
MKDSSDLFSGLFVYNRFAKQEVNLLYSYYHGHLNFKILVIFLSSFLKNV